MQQSNGRPRPSITTVPPNDEDRVSQFLDAMAGAFERTALSMCFIVEIDGTPPPFPSPLINRTRVRKHISKIIESASKGAVLVEAGDMSALAVWEPPIYSDGEPKKETEPPMGPLRAEFMRKRNDMKKKYLSVKDGTGDEHDQVVPHYRLGFLGRNPDKPSVAGGISAVIEPFLARAREEKVPAFLEATTLHAVEVYQYMGFRLLEEIRVGIGQRNEDGWPEDGGSGVPCYIMICDDHLAL